GLQLRIALAQRRQHARQQERRDRRDDAELQRAFERAALPARELDERRQIPQAKPREHGDFLAQRRDRDLAVRAVHEVHVERRLELADRDAEGRLRDEALGRRAAEVLLLGERDEVAQLLERRKVCDGFGHGSWGGRGGGNDIIFTT